MMFEFDEAKNEANIVKHGVSLSRVEAFEPLAIVEDDRHDYGESRYLAFGYLDGVAHCLVFTDRNGVLRVIRLRRAHKKELDRYVP